MLTTISNAKTDVEALQAALTGLNADDALALIDEVGEYIDDLHIVLYGRTADVEPYNYGWTRDPMWREGDDKITKRIELGDLKWTLKRWRRMCRTIDSVYVAAAL